jgi:hypothetical protein
MILRFASRSEGKEGCEGEFGKKKIPTSSNTLSLFPPQWLRHSCPMTHDAPWDKTPLQKPVHKRPEQKNFQKSLKTNQPTNPLLPITVREEQQQHQRGQHNEVILNYDIGILTPPLQSVVVLIRVWRWWVPWTTNMTCKTKFSSKIITNFKALKICNPFFDVYTNGRGMNCEDIGRHYVHGKEHF